MRDSGGGNGWVEERRWRERAWLHVVEAQLCFLPPDLPVRRGLAGLRRSPLPSEQTTQQLHIVPSLFPPAVAHRSRHNTQTWVDDGSGTCFGGGLEGEE